MSRMLLATGSLLLAAAAGAHDFSQYTVITGDLKATLRANWQARFNASGHVHGNVAVFGNSITQPAAFWTPFAESGSVAGIVPGTNQSSYLVNKANPVFCAVSGYRIDNGLACLPGALDTLKPEVTMSMYGTNDSWSVDTAAFQQQYRTYLDTLLTHGVVPIVSTIPPIDFYYADSLYYDSIVRLYNRTITKIAREKNVVLVDFWQAFMDYTHNNPFTDTWYEDLYVHPSPCSPAGLTDTSAPGCGLGIRNAVTWHAVNKVYRVIINDGAPDPASITFSRKPPSPHVARSMEIWTRPDGKVLHISWSQPVSLVEIYTIDGRRAARYRDPGGSSLAWNSGGSAGVFVVKVTDRQGRVEVKKTVLSSNN